MLDGDTVIFDYKKKVTKLPNCFKAKGSSAHGELKPLQLDSILPTNVSCLINLGEVNAIYLAALLPA